MVKKLSVLKAGRGFTLVELIVVIAIIAVLAALITPVMMGYVESANVQSANNTAAKICQFVNTFLVTCDVEERGMRLSSSNTATYKITISGTSWSFESEGTFDGSNFNQSGTPWVGRTSKPIGQGETDIECAEDEMALLMAESFPPVKDASGWVYLEGGKCLYCWFARGSISANVPAKDDFVSGEYAWNGSKDGVNADGVLVGTYPPLLMPI